MTWEDDGRRSELAELYAGFFDGEQPPEFWSVDEIQDALEPEMATAVLQLQSAAVEAGALPENSDHPLFRLARALARDPNFSRFQMLAGILGLLQTTLQLAEREGLLIVIPKLAEPGDD